MGRPTQISTSKQMTRRHSSWTSIKSMSILTRRRMVLSLVALTLWMNLSSATSYEDLDSDLMETETGWQFNDDDTIEAFDNSTTPAPSPTTTTKAISGRVALINGDFEMTNVTDNSTTLADATATTMIPNWLPGGAGVQVIQSSTYKMSSFAKSMFAIHLNNPASTANGTQGLIASTLAVNPTSGKTFTVQFDCARMPDGPLNLLSALKVSSISGTTTNQWILHHVKYNVTDTLNSITWQRQSFVYSGTGASTKLQFESMSEKYGPAIDNVVILTGSHPLSAAPSAHLLSLWQQLCPIFIVLAFHYSPLVSLL